MSGWRADLIAVVRFYSRLPVPVDAGMPGAGHAADLARAVWILPLASVLVALPGAAVLVLASVAGLTPVVAALLAVGTLAVVTGALHEDGFADCADGFWGGSGPARRLEIMRDSRIGTYGVLALVVAVMLRAELLGAVLPGGAIGAACVFLAAAVAGRAVALYPWVGLPNAREGGLAVAVGRPSLRAFRTTLLLAIAVTAALVAWISPLGFVVAGVAAALAAKAVASIADAKIGGHTGDVIGAAVVAGDLSYLIAFTICA